MNKRGFTLVELSIVLVIIGLLIGGILAAQSMIQTTRINSQAQQIAQFDAGVISFKERFQYLPGDAPSFQFSDAAWGGNGDGRISSIINPGNAFNPMVSAFNAEIANFWHSFDPAAFPGVATQDPANGGLPSTTSGPNKNAPLSKIGGTNAWVSAMPLSDGASNLAADTKHYYVILDGNQAKTRHAGYYFFRTTDPYNGAHGAVPADLASLDSKIDDGAASTGQVISGSIAGCCSAGGPVEVPEGGKCSAGNTYYVTRTAFECTPLIRMGGSANPQ